MGNNPTHSLQSWTSRREVDLERGEKKITIMVKYDVGKDSCKKMGCSNKSHKHSDKSDQLRIKLEYHLHNIRKLIYDVEYLNTILKIKKYQFPRQVKVFT
jgi:hypothetical protein